MKTEDNVALRRIWMTGWEDGLEFGRKQGRERERARWRRLVRKLGPAGALRELMRRQSP